MDTLFATILDDGHNLVGAAKCSLFFVDQEKGELWTKVATDNDGEIKVRRRNVYFFRSRWVGPYCTAGAGAGRVTLSAVPRRGIVLVVEAGVGFVGRRTQRVAMRNKRPHPPRVLCRLVDPLRRAR